MGDFAGGKLSFEIVELLHDGRNSCGVDMTEPWQALPNCECRSLRQGAIDKWESVSEVQAIPTNYS